MRKLIWTQPEISAAIARIGLGVFILPHGLQKAFGLFGGHGIQGTVEGMGQGLGIPALLAYLVIAAEFLGGLGLIFGFLTRIAAFGVTVTLIVAALLVHLPIGFFSGQGGAGWELHLLAAVLGLIVILRGGGIGSVDLALTPEYAREEGPDRFGEPRVTPA